MGASGGRTGLGAVAQGGGDCSFRLVPSSFVWGGGYLMVAAGGLCLSLYFCPKSLTSSLSKNFDVLTAEGSHTHSHNCFVG